MSHHSSIDHQSIIILNHLISTSLYNLLIYLFNIFYHIKNGHSIETILLHMFASTHHVAQNGLANPLVQFLSI